MRSNLQGSKTGGADALPPAGFKISDIECKAESFKEDEHMAEIQEKNAKLLEELKRH